MDNVNGAVENDAPSLDLSHVVHIQPQNSSEQQRLPEEQQTTGQSSEHFQGNTSSGSQSFTDSKCQMNFNINPNNQDMIHMSVPANDFSQTCDRFFSVHQRMNFSNNQYHQPNQGTNSQIIDPDIIIISDDESIPSDAETVLVVEPRTPEEEEKLRIYLEERKKQQEDLNKKRNISNENQGNSNKNQENSNESQENSNESQENSNENQENLYQDPESREYGNDVLLTPENPQLMDDDDIEEELYRIDHGLSSLNDPK